ncbi:hypothetical protein BDP27DRAFT_1319071 [Rhodocollybia butyracea]|uniref:Uncharacterized protein n=1 Tax=Rhodocollybia butyracea TaxID=206335 RepID=A0A9P5UAM8_9AGAR|nr:hypothetical protein BDP27DRAFT_1319071 [Rhodocollybia butyracea]
MERNWQKLPISSPTSPTLSSDDVLGALRNGRLAGANGKNSVLLVLRRKAVEIYDASEAAQAQRHKETLKHLATAACNLVYAILSANEQVPLQDRTLNHVENLLDRVLHAIRTIQGSSSTSVVYRSFLRRKGPSVSEAQLQNYVDQLYHMLFQFQVISISAISFALFTGCSRNVRGSLGRKKPQHFR